LPQRSLPRHAEQRYTSPAKMPVNDPNNTVIKK
jgi:hypothetical protein